MTVDLKLAEAVLRLIVFRRERSDQYEVVNKQLIELDSGYSDACLSGQDTDSRTQNLESNVTKSLKESCFLPHWISVDAYAEG